MRDIPQMIYRQSKERDLSVIIRESLKPSNQCAVESSLQANL